MFGHARGPKPKSIQLAVSRWTAHYSVQVQRAAPRRQRDLEASSPSASKQKPSSSLPSRTSSRNASDARPHNPQSEQDENHAESAGLRSAPSTICSKGGHLRTSGPICGEYPQAKTLALLGYQGRRSASQWRCQWRWRVYGKCPRCAAPCLRDTIGNQQSAGVQQRHVTQLSPCRPELAPNEIATQDAYQQTQTLTCAHTKSCSAHPWPVGLWPAERPKLAVGQLIHNTVHNVLRDAHKTSIVPSAVLLEDMQGFLALSPRDGEQSNSRCKSAQKPLVVGAFL